MTAQAPLAADPVEVRAFMEILHARAAAALNGAPRPGMLQLVCIHPDQGSTVTIQYEIGDVELMTGEAVRQAVAGYNVYAEGRTVREGARKRGTLADTVGTFAFVVDMDHDKGKGGALTLEPSLSVETSPGNVHKWLFLDRALTAEEAQPIGAAIRARTKADSATAKPTQPYRVAGTANYPDRKKRERGRATTITRILDTGRTWTADELRAAFPDLRKKRESNTGQRETGPSGKTSATAEVLAAETGPTDRSDQFFHVVDAAIADGLTIDDTEALLRRYPDGCGGKYLDPYDRLRREIERVWAKIHDRAEREGKASAEPTYPDRRVSLVEAEAETRGVITTFFADHVPAYRAERATWEAAHAAWKVDAEVAKTEGREPPPEPSKPEPTAWAARIETGIGKTEIGIDGAAGAAGDGIVTIHAAPMHSLLSELAERYAARGVEARVYRGYTSQDPDTPGLTMCLDLTAMQDARDAGAAIPTAVCKRTVEGQKLLCPFIDRCGMEKQRNAKATVWLVPHALLGQMKPAFIPEPDAVVIDEGITMGALPDKPARLSLDTIEKAPIDPCDNAPIFTNFANDLQSARGNLLRALRAHAEDGPLQRALLIRHGITRAIAGSAYTMEWGRKREPGITPGMSPVARKACAAAVGQHNAEVMLLAGLWNEIREFLAGDADASGRLSLRFDADAGARFVERRSLNAIASSWAAPVLLLDATLPEAALIEPVIGQRVDIRADITARWSEHVRIRQILRAPVTASKLGIVEGKQPESARRSVHHLVRLIRLRAALAWPRVVVVIAPKRLVALFDDIGLPQNVETGHFGAVSGIDRWRTTAGLICIGRLLPGPPVAETMAGVMTGRVPQTVPPAAHGGTWYPKVEAGIRLATGEGIRVEVERHPDPIAEALRAQVAEGGLIQAIGRLRTLRRTAETPAFLDIVSDVPLPISIDEAVTWDEALPGAWADLAPVGVLFGSAADLMRAFPGRAPTRKVAREHTVASSALTSIENYSIGIGAALATVFAYQRRGRAEPATGYLLPSRPTNLRGWLVERLKGLEWLKVEGEEVRRPAAATPEDDGVALDSPIDMAAAWPGLWATMVSARDWRSRNGGIVLPGASTRFRYQRAGRNQKWRTGAYDPAVVPDLRAWLESRLGPLAGFEILEPASTDASAGPAPLPRCADYDPALAAAYRCVSDHPAVPSRPSPVIPEIVTFDPSAGICWPAFARAARHRANPSERVFPQAAE